jgi:ribonuclease P protein component
VVRNRLKRQLRTIMALETASLPPGNFLVRVYPAAASFDYDRLRNSVAGAAAQAAGAVGSGRGGRRSR